MSHSFKRAAARLALASILSSGLVVPSALAESEALFSGGDTRLLQQTFDDMGYQGVKGTETGLVNSGQDDEREVLKVVYDDSKLTYKKLLGKYVRNIDITDGKGQSKFSLKGSKYIPEIYSRSDQEAKDAKYVLGVMERIGIYSKSDPAAVKIASPKETQAAQTSFVLDLDKQDFYKKKGDDFDKINSKRKKYFDDVYKPIKTTACEGSICGFVYFPCSEDNLCLSIVNGDW